MFKRGKASSSVLLVSFLFLQVFLTKQMKASVLCLWLRVRLATLLVLHHFWILVSMHKLKHFASVLPPPAGQKKDFSACRMVALVKLHDITGFLVYALTDILSNGNASYPIINGGALEMPEETYHFSSFLDVPYLTFVYTILCLWWFASP